MAVIYRIVFFAVSALLAIQCQAASLALMGGAGGYSFPGPEEYIKVGERFELAWGKGSPLLYACRPQSLTVSRYGVEPAWGLGTGLVLKEPCYQCELIALDKNAHSIDFHLEPGTHYFRLGKNGGTFCGEVAPQRASSQWLQVAVRAGDDYLGLLQELRGTPFLVFPEETEFGNQADLRVGADCAALAIYGRRRLGFNVPYGGPRGIVKYLSPLDNRLLIPGSRTTGSISTGPESQKAASRPSSSSARCRTGSPRQAAASSTRPPALRSRQSKRTASGFNEGKSERRFSGRSNRSGSS
jgi:hypothetical protein